MTQGSPWDSQDKYKHVLESAVRRGLVVGLGTVEALPGQEKGKQPGFSWMLALLLLMQTATEQEGHGQVECPLFLFSILLALPRVLGVRRPLSRNAEPGGATVTSTASATVSGNHNCLHENHIQNYHASIRGLARILVPVYVASGPSHRSPLICSLPGT